MKNDNMFCFTPSSRVLLTEAIAEIFTIVTNPTNRNEFTNKYIISCGGCILNLSDYNPEISKLLSQRYALLLDARLFNLRNNAGQKQHEVFILLKVPLLGREAHDRYFRDTHSCVLKVMVNLDFHDGFYLLKTKCSYYKITMEANNVSISFQLLNMVLNSSLIKYQTEGGSSTPIIAAEFNKGLKQETTADTNTSDESRKNYDPSDSIVSIRCICGRNYFNIEDNECICLKNFDHLSYSDVYGDISDTDAYEDITAAIPITVPTAVPITEYKVKPLESLCAKPYSSTSKKDAI
jgi:hypothetical protein